MGGFGAGIFRAFLFAVAALLILWGNAMGLVLHPGGEPYPGSRPADAVVGRWGTNASCVAVSPNYLITTKHQLGGVGTSVFFNGIEYEVKEVWNEPIASGEADLRVCRIGTLAGGPANLTDWASLYTPPTETGKDIVIGGFGKGRGADYEGIGYWWLGSDNQTQRWGENLIDSISSTTVDISGTDHTSEVIVADFDLSPTYEAMIADFDSGSGWFTDSSGQWKVAGVSQGVTTWGMSLFDPPDDMTAIRISSYDSWISGKLIEPTCTSPVDGDLDGSCAVGTEDLAIFLSWWGNQGCNSSNNYCDGADMAAPSGNVNLADLAVIAMNWDVCGLDLAWGCPP